MFINDFHIVAVGVSSLLLLLVSRRCCCRIGFLALPSNVSASCSCRFCFVVGSGVPSCGCVRRFLRLVVGGVLLLLLAVPSPQSKLTYLFVPKCQQVIGTIREVFEINLALLFLQQVPGLCKRCTFTLANGLAGRIISRY